MNTQPKRERIIRFRVNDEEYNAIEKAAEGHHPKICVNL